MKKVCLLAACVVGFFFIAAPIYMNVPVNLNGRPVMNAQLINNTWAVPLDEFVKLTGGGLTLEPNFQLQGNKLVAVSSGGDRVAKKAVQPTTDSVAKIKLQPSGLITVRKAGVISNSVFKSDGKAFVPLADVAHALGGTFTAPQVVRPGQSFTLNFGANGIIGPD